MDLQHVLDIVVGILIAGIGWMLNQLWAAHKELSLLHHKHTREVAEQYVNKIDFKGELEHIRQTCDNIWKALRKGE